MSTVGFKNFLKRNYLFVIITVLAFTIHFTYLSYPAQTVFDEIYFGKFAASYFTHQYYFDIHPPLGKLMIAGWSDLIGYKPVFDYDKIGQAVDPNMLFAMRSLPALFGAMLIPLFSWFAYLATRSKKAAIVAGSLILLDNAFLVQSKLILVDAFLVFFEILTLCFFLLYQKQKIFSRKWFAFLLLTAISFGLTASIKWTGLASIAIIGVVLLFKIFNKELASWLDPENYPAPKNPADAAESGKVFKSLRRVRIKEAAIGFVTILAVGFMVYLIPFYIHFNLLNKSGPGDAFMSQKFQEELRLGRNKVNQPLDFWQKFSELNTTMFAANWGITATHPFSSKWYNWPFDNKPIYYWAYSPEDGTSRLAKIYLAGNPILWWLALGAIIFTLIKTLSKKWREDITPFAYILILGYLVNLLPFVGIKRVAFLYHYFLSLSFAILLLSVYLAKIWQKERTTFFAIMLAIVLAFAILTPVSYGWLMTPSLNQFEIKIIDFLS